MNIEGYPDRCVTRRFFPNRQRYHYDFKQCVAEKGWKQYDTEQDFSCFGVWVNLEKMQVMTFAEGDETLEEYKSLEDFRNGLESMEKFYGSPPPFAVSIDADGTITKYFDERPTLDQD